MARERREFLKLAAFLLSAARLLRHEPPAYGPYRLLDGACRSLELAERIGLGDDDLRSLAGVLEAARAGALADDEEMDRQLDRALAAVRASLKRED